MHSFRMTSEAGNVSAPAKECTASGESEDNSTIDGDRERAGSGDGNAATPSASDVGEHAPGSEDGG